jgi:hypothetical protein
MEEDTYSFFVTENGENIIGCECKINEIIYDNKTKSQFISLNIIKKFTNNFYKLNNCLKNKIIITPHLGNYQCFIKEDNNYLGNSGNYLCFLSKHSYSENCKFL